MIAIPFAIISAIGNTYVALIIMSPFAVLAFIGGVIGYIWGRINVRRWRRAREREQLEQIWQGWPSC